jgi:TolB-like protein/class 3 adenylate cyclase/Flp pilus assembly protein TadD
MNSADVKLEIGHVLFIDIVGYSKLLINEQGEQIQKLKEIVRATEQFRLAEAEGKLLRLPTGDGGALVFRNSPEAPVLCALEISKALKSHPELHVRMGIHSGPVNEITDLNEQANIAGAGINIAQRVMNCGDAGHILVSRHVAEDLEQYRQWQPCLHDLGECEVKHGARLHAVNLYTDEVGNSQVPEKFKTAWAVEKARPKSAIPKWALIGAAVLILIVVATGFLVFQVGTPLRGLRQNAVAEQGRPGGAPLPISEKSIAVLPLENLSEEKENAFFADGIQDELLSNLSKIKDLKVISRTSVMQYKTAITRNLREIARQLGVSNVVEGSVRRSGNHIRVSVQLIDALTDRHIWVQNYDRTLADSLALQGELATEIAAGVGATLSPQEKARVEAKPTNNPAAYDAYLRGRAAEAGSLFDKSNVERAIQSYQEAVKLDPSFVPAWVRLSFMHSNSYWIGHDPSSARLAAAKDAADRALALDPNLPETHLALGYYRYYGQHDFAGALAEFQQAEQGLPSNVDVIRAIALIQRRLGHWDEAIAELRRAVELDPRNIDASSGLALTCRAVRRFTEALASVDRVLALEPANTDALGLKAHVFRATGDLQAVEPLLANPGISPLDRSLQALFQRRYAAAIEILSNAVAADSKLLDPRNDERLLLGLSQQRAGDVAAARATYQKAAQDFQRQLNKVARDSFKEAELHAVLGRAYAGLGEAASAVTEGQKAIAMHPTSKDPFEGPCEEEIMAQIYALLGDADHAIPILKRLLQIPYAFAITPGLLRLDPIWDQIRNDPRFQQLCQDKQL